MKQLKKIFQKTQMIFMVMGIKSFIVTYKTISNSKRKYLDGSEGIKSLKIIKAIYKSAQTKKEIFI